MTLPAGPGWVCFDTTGLIHFNLCGELTRLGGWFPRAFAPAVVIDDEIRRHLRAHPENQAILDAGWLETVTIDDPAVMGVAADIHRRFGRTAGQDRGEAEVVALCAERQWTAIIDDTNGQKAARDHGVAHCSILTMILAAAAHELIGADDAWKLHCALEASRGHGRSALTAQNVHRPVFTRCIVTFARVTAAKSLTWPHILAAPGLDGLVLRTRSQTP